ncbi:MAG: pantoate--beta-alanine ligase [Bacteriovoracaceae bacterium]
MVIVHKSTNSLISERNAEKNSVGFVPTMGNLHEGHLSLLREALKYDQVVYFSIFVNPKQFGPSEDFNRYPRTLEDDLRLIEKVAKEFPSAKVVVYAPVDPAEVYPAGYDQKIDVPDLSGVLEGALRPGHFEGVATVVYRLFEIVRPREAYFGLKDYQQFLVIKKMVKDLQLSIKITGMPIIRDHDGLALSSRNQYLNTEERQEALILSRTLNKIKEIVGEKSSNLSEAKKFIADVLKDKRWNYLELRDGETLSTDISHSKILTLLAVFQLRTTRLLDNLQMELK